MAKRFKIGAAQWWFLVVADDHVTLSLGPWFWIWPRTSNVAKTGRALGITQPWPPPPESN